MMKFYQTKENGEIIAVKEGETADLTGMIFAALTVSLML